MLGSDLRSGTITIGNFVLGGAIQLTGAVALKSGYSWPTVTNAGNFVQSANGSLTLWYGASFVNASGATYRINNDLGITVREPSEYLRWENKAGASLIKSGGSGLPILPSVIDIPLTNHGLVKAESGVLRLDAGGTHGTGASLVTDQGNLQLGGTHRMTGIVSLISLHEHIIDAEDLRIDAGAAVDNQAVLRIAAVSSAATPQLINRGSLVTRGNGLILLPAGSLLENHGSFVVSSGLRAGGQFDNQGSVLVQGQWQTADPSDTSTGGSITNSGTLRIATGGALVTHDLTQSAGTLTVDGHLDAYGGIVRVQGGKLDGNGVINGDSFVGGTAATARFTPGHSPGHMTINGTLTMAANSELELQVERLADGTLAWDRVTATHISFLGGSTVHFVIGANVATAAFQSLAFLDCGTRGGAGPGGPFDPFNPFGPGAGFIDGASNANVVIDGAPGASWQFSDSGLTLMLAPALAVPEPGSAGMLVVGLLCLWGMTRRRMAIADR